MGKVRLSEIATETAKNAKLVYEKALEMGLSVKTPSSSVSQEDAAALFEFLMSGVNPRANETKETSKKTKSTKTKTPAESKSSTKEVAKTTTKKTTKTKSKQTESTDLTSVEQPEEVVKVESSKESPPNLLLHLYWRQSQKQVFVLFVKIIQAM